ncbi:MmcQ/YjbR family DNA-binding protein, partial [uncultured Pluralibacter sp.]|uniref:MmcQ/YjbR family DNA-binding protein n=1 Tax=uncultured Pluralibacter sp. TaxID=1490864 RepID=UPI002624A1F0
KAEPAQALLHQAIYQSITPGYHMNKKHWISVHGGGEITAELLESLIDDSRDRVIDTLPLRVQQRLSPR